MAKCDKCDRETSSLLEEKLSLCVDDIIFVVTNAKEAETSKNDVQSKLNLCQEQLTKCSSQIEKFKSFLAAESAGINASESGLAVDQNPYKQEDERHVLWFNGWQHSELQRRAAQAIAVLSWTNDVLQSMTELASGYGHTEMADKMRLISEKIDRFIKK